MYIHYVYFEARRFPEWQVSARPVSTCHDHLAFTKRICLALGDPFQLCTASARICEFFLKMGNVRRLKTTWHFWIFWVQEQAEQAAAFQELEEEVQAIAMAAVIETHGRWKRHVDSKI